MAKHSKPPLTLNYQISDIGLRSVCSAMMIRAMQDYSLLSTHHEATLKKSTLKMRAEHGLSGLEELNRFFESDYFDDVVALVMPSMTGAEAHELIYNGFVLEKMTKKRRPNAHGKACKKNNAG